MRKKKRDVQFLLNAKICIRSLSIYLGLAVYFLKALRLELEKYNEDV